MWEKWIKVLIVTLSLIGAVLLLWLTNISAKKNYYAGAVVPHHDVASSVTKNTLQEIANTQIPSHIVLVGPDHFDRANTFSATLGSADNKESQHIMDALVGIGVIGDSEIVNAEHAVAGPRTVIKEIWPDAKITPIIVSTHAPRQHLDKMIATLNDAAPKNTLYIASVDFSHYLPTSATRLHDIRSIGSLANDSLDEISSLEVDSWQSLYIVRSLAEHQNSPHFSLVEHKTTTDFLDSEIEENTGYIGGLWSTESSIPVRRTPTIIAVGDILLARDIDRLMKTRGALYPFQKIQQFLWGADIVLGNLEGPIIEKPFPVPTSTTRFSFSPDVTDVLRQAYFSTLNIANNHILDAGEGGVESAVKYLKEEGINPIGNLLNKEPLVSIQEVGEERIGLIGLADFPSSIDPTEWPNTVAEVASKTTFTVATVHWGPEYQTSSTARQQELARQLVEAGADVVLGHHPHVVQEIEIINGKPVFYSLGNFIFDQYGRKETNEGLAVGIEVGSDEIIYRLFPLQLGQGQPRLMAVQESNEFLEGLAQRSGKIFSNDIQKSILTLTR